MHIFFLFCHQTFFVLNISTCNTASGKTSEITQIKSNFLPKNYDLRNVHREPLTIIFEKKRVIGHVKYEFGFVT